LSDLRLALQNGIAVQHRGGDLRGNPQIFEIQNLIRVKVERLRRILDIGQDDLFTNTGLRQTDDFGYAGRKRWFACLRAGAYDLAGRWINRNGDGLWLRTASK